MKLRLRWTYGLLLLLTLTPAAPAQQFVPLADGTGSTFVLNPVASGGANPFIDPTGSGMNLQSQVGGRSSANTNNAEIGFDYLRPYWTSRDFTLAVPAIAAPAFPILGDTGHVDNQFALVPNVKYSYHIEDTALSISANGTFLGLNGKLDQTVVANAGQGHLTATSSLTIIVANLPEVTGRFYCDEFFSGHSHSHWSFLDELIVDLGIGTRYSSINQTYTGDLSNTGAAGLNQTTRSSTQSYVGVGLTTKANLSLPVQDNWVFYTNVRGSILVGTNDKESTLTVNLAGAATTTTIKQSRTEFIPIVEVETGVQWGAELANSLRNGAPPPLCTIRVAAVGQFWGDVGPLSAGSPQGFRTSNLFLVGAHVMVGLHR
jgi:hypothetical protein